MADRPIPPRAQYLDPAGAAAVPPPADRVPAPPPPSGGDTADQPDTPALVRGVQLWMALDLWSALGREPADFEAVVGIDGWADTWAELNGAVRDLVAEHAKTVSNFEEFAEAWAEERQRLTAELAALAPGWESPAALQAAYSDVLARWEAAEAERDQARRDAASWEDWGRGWKTQAEANQVERDKAWAELDAVKAERDRRGDLLKRAQATFQAVLDIHDDGTRGVCCGQAWPCETVHALREAATDEVPPPTLARRP